MAYNNGFPLNYGYAMPQPVAQQPMMAQPMMQQQQQPAQNSNMIWVLGEAGAKSFLMSPNCTLSLWDSEEQVIYLKSTDASGMPSMKVLDYTIRGNSSGSTSKTPLDNKPEEYVTKEEFDSYKDEVSKMIKKELEA